MHRSARWSAGPAIVAALLGASAHPASAGVAAEIELYVGDSTVAVARHFTDGARIQPWLSSSTPVTLHGAHITFDATDLAGVATIADEPGGTKCTPRPRARLVCEVPGPVQLTSVRQLQAVSVKAQAAPTAEPGDTGRLTATFTARGIEPVTIRTTVRVAEGVDLAAEPPEPVRASPGADFDVPMTVRNEGAVPIRGAAVIFENSYAVQPARRFSNCHYRGDELRSCVFDERLRPGVRYRLTMPYRMRADTYAPGDEQSRAQWLTTAQWEDRPADPGAAPGRPGDVLRLTAVTGARSVPQIDTDRLDNWFYLTISVPGKQNVDLVAVGDRVAGVVGATVTATVGVRNAGPATLDLSDAGENAAHIDLTVPPGATVVTVDPHCRRLVDGEVAREQHVSPGGRAYRCFTAYRLPAGTAVMFDIGLRLDRAGAGAAGPVVVYDHCACPQLGLERDPSNNTAALVVDIDAATDTAPDGGTGTGTGSLPVTGPAGAATAAAGMLLLVSGAAGVVLARPRVASRRTDGAQRGAADA